MLKISNLFMNYGEAEILSGINLHVEKGELFALLGPSGSGKSTVLRSVAGLERPTRGDIAIGDRVVFSSAHKVQVPAEKRQLAMVFQSYALWPHLTVRQNVELALQTGERKLGASLARERVDEALHAVELEQHADRPVPRLSGGQQQRVALARALATKPEMMLMDEPLCNLDARLRETIREKIKTLVKDAVITVLYVTHDQSEAMAIADRIAVMAQGRVRQVGAPRDLYMKPDHPRIAAFLGDVNWIPGKSDGTSIAVDFGRLVTSQSPIAGLATAGIRPEGLKLSSDMSPRSNAFACSVESVSFLGEAQLVRIDIAGTKLTAKVDGAAVITRNMCVTADPSEILLYPGSLDMRPTSWPD